jgi:DNA replication licensing factor MCM3
VEYLAINFSGSFGKNYMTPRGLNAAMSNQLVAVEGVISAVGDIKSNLEKSLHYCEKTKCGLVKDYYREGP